MTWRAWKDLHFPANLRLRNRRSKPNVCSPEIMKYLKSKRNPKTLFNGYLVVDIKNSALE